LASASATAGADRTDNPATSHFAPPGSRPAAFIISDLNIAVPDKRELDLGKPLVLDFAREFLPDELDYIRDMFSRRGAYGQFKALLTRRKAVNLWHDFEGKAQERALRAWCEANSIALTD